MEKLSPRCKMISAAAVACLVAAIVAAPAAPRITFLTDDSGGQRRGAAGAASLPVTVQGEFPQLPNCAGGDSVNCHRAGNQAGL